MTTVSKNNPSEKFCCKRGERDASWGKSGVKKGFLFKWKKLKHVDRKDPVEEKLDATGRKRSMAG